MIKVLLGLNLKEIDGMIEFDSKRVWSGGKFRLAQKNDIQQMYCTLPFFSIKKGNHSADQLKMMK
jgi:hypothetical protein